MNTPLRFASVLALFAAALAASAQNLVQDPGFESAIGTPGGTMNYSTGQSIDGGSWTVGSPAPGVPGLLQVDKNSRYVISGTTSVVFAGISLVQTLATSTAVPYLVSFDAYCYDSAMVPLTVGFGTSTYSTPVPVVVTSPTAPPTSYHFSFLATASSPSTVLRFSAPNSSLFEFDNVSVVAAQPTPEPSALAALGLGVLAMLRRRKRA